LGCDKFVCMYHTNLAGSRVCEIHAARMNHSCNPNTRVLTDGANFYVRAIAKIKAGEELTFSYSIENLSMKNRETRQNVIRNELGFICVCDFCKFGQENQEIISEFQKLKQELKRLQNLHNKNPRPKLTEIDMLPRFLGMLEALKNDARQQNQTTEIQDRTMMKEIKCYKDMFNLAKNNKTSWNFSWGYLYENILLKGFEVAVLGYLLSLKKEDEEQFKRECNQFSQYAKNIDQMLNTTVEERRLWQSMQDIFEPKCLFTIPSNPEFNQPERLEF